MANRKTKTEKIEEVKGIVKASGVENIEELIEMLTKMQDSIARKNANKGTSTNAKANEEFRTIIVEMINNSEMGLTITDIQEKTDNETLASLSNQRMSAIISPLIDNVNYFRVKKGKKTFYATEEQAEKLKAPKAE